MSSLYWLSILILLFGARCDIAQTVMERTTPNALWWVVSSCVKNEEGNHPLQLCEKVDLKKGYAVIKDRRGKTQFLLVPTARIEGIESPEILRKDLPNYWQPAWDARSYVSKRAGRKLPDDDIGLEINSAYARTQNQLHIHIDCLKPEVIKTLKDNKDKPEGKWFTVSFPHSSHHYQALYVDNLKTDPFKLVAQTTKEMAAETIAVAHVSKRFIVMSDASQGASGEELLDHACVVAEKK